MAWLSPAAVSAVVTARESARSAGRTTGWSWLPLDSVDGILS